MEKSKNKSFIESGYSENAVSNFSDYLMEEKPIKTTGTTCDTFSARFESRRVFVKQLKPEYSSNPVYRSAFQKEYELGVTLGHPSIPQYIKFTGDSLIINFVDGKTLHQMIQSLDPRLHSDSNIEKWVGQLLNVIDYLHARNVIHCDIKTDNIMITNDTRNLMLIDFDKAFTTSQDLTPGTPLNFGSEDENLTKRQMDVRGVRNIIEKLLQYIDSHTLKERMGKLVAMAGSPEVTIPELLEIWDQPVPKQSVKRKYFGWLIEWIIIVALFVIVWSYIPKESPEVIRTEDIPEVDNSEKIIPNDEKIADRLEKSINNELSNDTLPAPVSQNSQDKGRDDSWNVNVNELQPINANSFPTQEQYWEEIRQRTLDRGYEKWLAAITDDVVIIDNLMDSIENEINKGDLTSETSFDLIIKLAEGVESFNSKINKKYYNLYPNTNKDERYFAVVNSEVLREHRKRESDLNGKLEIYRKNKL